MAYFENNKTSLSANILNQNELQSTTMLPNNKVSTFSQNHKIFTTFDSGKLVPLMSKSVIPGDTFEIDIKALIKQVSPVFPTMGNAKIQFFTFFVPNRLIYEKFKYFMGENRSTWYNNEDYKIPHVKSTKNSFTYNENDLASYLGLPINKNLFANGNTYNRLKFNAYCQVWNDWFRDENLQNEVYFSKDGDLEIDNYKNIGNEYELFYNSLQYGKLLAPVSKLPDYFTTCLPSTQKGPIVNILSSLGDANIAYGDIEKGQSTYIAKLSESDAVFGVNDLRFSIALQQFRELNARSGTRYIELVLAHFGVKSKDLRTQRSQYLGGFTRNILMTQVTQMVESQENNISSGLGAFGGFSNTFIESLEEEKILFSSEEHGYLNIYFCVRVEQIYSQGIEKDWNKRDIEDFYFPTFANIGEQPVYSSEIFYNENKKNETTIFGYNEAWSYLRWEQNKITGYFSPNSTKTLLSFTYGNNFLNEPTLNNAFIQESKKNVAQTLRVQNTHQYYGEFAIIMKVSRLLPIQSIPGLSKI